jgi:PIN domain nuclease of toxin-antitoxin system
VLVDTHALLWFLAGDEQLSRPARRLIEDPENVLLISAASIWEMAIKKSSGKLEVPDDLPEIIRSQGFGVLAVDADHAWAVAQLPATDHKDPFDRQLAAQALVEGVPVISRDARLDSYGVTRLW